jgi:hypothetical protein
MEKRMRNIRKSDLKDIHVIMQLIENGREKMRADGNSEQWTNGNPRQSLIEDDIMKGNSYIVEDDGVAVATFAFIEGPDITYNNIYEGKWMDNSLPYYVIHRMASVHGVYGVFKSILEYCFERTGNIRIDTHRQNSIMRNALEKYGFAYCGIIYLLDGAERLAYQRTLP